MTFFDNYLYLTTLIIVIICTPILIVKKETIINIFNPTTQRKTYFYLGLVALALEIIFVIDLIYNYRWNSLLHGDLCTFSFAVSGVIFIIGNKRAIRMISPWLIIGSFLTFAVGVLQFKPHFYVGETASYLKHVMMFVLGLVGLMPFNKYSKNELKDVIIFGTIFLVYVVLVPSSIYWSTKNPYWAVYSAGFLKPTYYEFVFETRFSSIKAGDFTILNIKWLPYPLATIVFYILVLLLMFGLVNVYIIDWSKIMKKLATFKDK